MKPLRPENEVDYAYFAHGPGLVLWDHLSYAMEYYEQDIYTTNPHDLEDSRIHRNEQFNNALGQVLTFFDRDKEDESLRRPYTVKYVEYLLDRYEKKDFSGPLLKKWDMAKQSIKRKREMFIGWRQIRRTE